MESLEQANNTELLSALSGKPAAAALLQRYGGLTSLAQASFEELQLINGIGKAKAAAIKSAFLLAQRLSREAYPEAPLLDTPERVADMLREQNRPYTVENFQVIFLNTRRRMIGMQVLSQGTLDTILVTPREVFLPAIARRAAAIVLVHSLCAQSHNVCISSLQLHITAVLFRARRSFHFRPQGAAGEGRQRGLSGFAVGRAGREDGNDAGELAGAL